MAENILVPAYFYPDASNGYWDRLAAAANLIGERLIVIANPNNGPGQAVDPNYTNAINNVVNSGGRVIGYVFTCYGGRFNQASPPPGCPRQRGHLDVDSDIDAWYTLYPNISGIFFDQVSNHPDDIDFYQIRYDNVQLLNPGGLVVFNPGQNTDIQYFNIGNSVQVIFEGTGADFLAWQPTTARHRRSCALVYNTLEVDYRDVLYQVRTHHLRYSYLTDDILHNPWNTLPSYFEQQIEDLVAFCSKTVCGSTEPGNTNWQVYEFGGGEETNRDNEHLVELYELFRAPDRKNDNKDTLQWRYPKDGQLYKLDPTTPTGIFQRLAWKITREGGSDSPIVMAFRPGFGSGGGILILSLEGASSHAAWLVHDEDDVPHKYFSAVDLGNTAFLPTEINEAYEQGTRMPYFILRVTDEWGCPVRPYARLRVGVLKRAPEPTISPSSGIYVDVDTSSAGFTSVPIYTISLGGRTRHWTTMGGNSVYQAAADGFRVYLKSVANVSPEQANEWGWHVLWSACGLTQESPVSLQGHRHLMGATYYPYLPQDIALLPLRDAQRAFLDDAVESNLTDKIGFFVLNPRGFDTDVSGQGNAIEYHGIMHHANSVANDDRVPPDQRKPLLGDFEVDGVPGLADFTNPRPGSGFSQDLNHYSSKHLVVWQEYVRRLKAQNIPVIAYVYTGWFWWRHPSPSDNEQADKSTLRTLEAVKQNVDDLYEYFPDLDGIFFDEVSQQPVVVGTSEQWNSIVSDPTKHNLLPYRALYEHVKSKPGRSLVVFNASQWHDDVGSYDFEGTLSPYRGNELYIHACDILCTYEAPFSSYRHDPGSASYNPGDPNRYKDIDWGKKYPSNRFFHIITGVQNGTDSIEALSKAKQRNVGYIYVATTDFGVLPPYYMTVLSSIGS